MAHPALWGIGALAVALIAAGLWLNQRPPTAAEPRAEPTAQPAPAAAPPQAQAVDAQHLLPPPRPTEAPSAAAPARAAPADPYNLLPPPRPTEADPLPDGDAARAGPPPSAADPQTAPDPSAPAGAALLPADRPTAYAGAPQWQLDLPEGLGEAQRRMIQSVIGGRHGAAPFFGAAAFAVESGAFGIVSGYGALAAAEAAALAQCRGDCAIVARLLPEDFDGRRSDTLNAAQAAAREELRRAAGQPDAPAGFYHVLAWSDEGALGTARLGNPEAARILALLACRTEQQRITGAEDGAPPCRAALVAPPRPPDRP